MILAAQLRHDRAATRGLDKTTPEAPWRADRSESPSSVMAVMAMNKHRNFHDCHSGALASANPESRATISRFTNR
jgi:hypothetical protein